MSEVGFEMRFGAKFFTTDWEPTYNAAPSQLLPVILGRNPLENSEHEIVLARWGFQPAWARNWRAQNNARVETANEKPMFRDAYRARHCLILAGDIARIDERIDTLATKEQMFTLHTQVNSIETQLRGMNHVKTQSRVADIEEEMFGKSRA